MLNKTEKSDKWWNSGAKLFAKIDRHPAAYGYLLLAVYLIINNTINVFSTWTEHSRDGAVEIGLWEPITWEYSSALSTFILAPILIWLFRRLPPTLSFPVRWLGIYLCLTVLFSAAHICLMVTFREAIYSWQGGDYNFGPVMREFWYEYRKDAWGYMMFYAYFYIARYIHVRMKGEANWVAQGEANAPQPVNECAEHLLVKKLDKEFLLNVNDIQWLESAGNYVNLHSNGRIYPLRTTMDKLTTQLASRGFSRVHRSYGVAHRAIESISYEKSGDGVITLKTGNSLPLSRRYKDQFKQTLS